MQHRHRTPRRLARTALLAAAAAAPLAAQDTSRVSLSATGAELAGNSGLPALSRDGRHVLFVATVDGVVPGDANLAFDAFLHDRATGEVELISALPATGLPGNDDSVPRDVSADGRFVAFSSRASDFAPGDANGTFDVFVKDRATGDVELVSVNVGGTPGNGPSSRCALSADGRFVAFESAATDLVAGDANGEFDVFLRDRLLGVTVMISRDTFGGPANGFSARPDVSADGRYVSFQSSAPDLVAGDANGVDDVFRFDRLTGTIERVSLDVAGGQLFGGGSSENSISDDGRLVAFQTAAQLSPLDPNGTADVAVRDLAAGTTWIASLEELGLVTGNGTSNAPALSGDGRWLLFASQADNLVPGDTNGAWDVFRVRVGSPGAERVSVSTTGVEGNANSVFGAMSEDGSRMAFSSFASTLAPGDGNGAEDVFVRDLGPAYPQLHCEGKTSSLGCRPWLTFSGEPSATSPEPFVVEGHDFLPGEAGILLYGTSGRGQLGFHGGTLCVKAPVVRVLPPKAAAASGPAPCAGVLRRDFNKRVQSGVDAALTVGQTVNAQWLQRDPADPAGFGDALSDGLEFTIGP